MSQLKYVIFFGAFAVGIPAGYKYAKQNKYVENFVFFLMIFFTCVEVTINFVSRETYRGTSRGFEIGLIDLACIIILLLIIDRKKKYPIKMLPPGSVLYFIFFFFSFLSFYNSDIMLYSWFEIWKMVRMYFYFWVIYNYINDFDRIEILMKYFGIILIYVFIIVLKQKYLMGIFQASGPFPHQNSLVMYNIILSSFIFALVFNKKKSNFMFWGMVFGMGGISIISTLSRAGMACFMISLMAIMFLTFLSGFSMRKIALTFVLALMGLGVLYKAMDSIIERFETAPEESVETRIVLAEAAVKMANDKKLGIGLNNFALKINPPYTYGDHIPATKGDDTKRALVETVYLNVAAETGWHNLVIYLIMLLTMYIRNIINFFRYKGHRYRFVLIGMLGGLTGIYIESTLEWVLKQTGNFYQLMMMLSLSAVMSKLIKMERRKKKYELRKKMEIARKK
ncbi:MAG: hypothetical protein GQ534_00085 [Candidatus Delongbacteria bacterium]|nr:hypothetical protein [Candidatus Delongbacteria bacterium]